VPGKLGVKIMQYNQMVHTYGKGKGLNPLKVEANVDEAG
jgi:hypothetical protein